MKWTIKELEYDIQILDEDKNVMVNIYGNNTESWLLAAQIVAIPKEFILGDIFSGDCTETYVKILKAKYNKGES